MLALIPPLRLVGLGLAMRTTVLPSLEDRIDEIAADADLDEEPDSHFKKLLGVLDRMEAIGVDAGRRRLDRRRTRSGEAVGRGTGGAQARSATKAQKTKQIGPIS